MPRGRRGGMGRSDIFPLLMLMGTLQEIGINRIPPVTLIFFGINMAIHFMATHIALGDVCIRPLNVIEYGQYQRLFLHSFFHVDTWHLYYNMASLLWKGLKLERKIGSSRLLIFTLISSVMVSILYILVAVSLTWYNPYDSTYGSCAVGFSGVLFSLKVKINMIRKKKRIIIIIYPKHIIGCIELWK